MSVASSDIPFSPQEFPSERTQDYAGLIVGLIQSGEIAPDRRIGETSLASRLEIPRAGVRAALEHLEFTGLVTRRARSGTYVRQISMKEFCDVMDIRAALEALAARLATQRAQKKELEPLGRLADLVDRLGQRLAEGDTKIIPKLVQADLKFHLALAHLSGNSRLATTLQQQRLLEYSFALASLPESLRSSPRRPIPTHREMIEAIESGNPSQAAQITRRHILRTKESRLGIFTDEEDEIL